jgi:hypothetical protein
VGLRARACHVEDYDDGDEEEDAEEPHAALRRHCEGAGSSYGSERGGLACCLVAQLRVDLEGRQARSKWSNLTVYARRGQDGSRVRRAIAGCGDRPRNQRERAYIERLT